MYNYLRILLLRICIKARELCFCKKLSKNKNGGCLQIQKLRRDAILCVSQMQVRTCKLPCIAGDAMHRVSTIRMKSFLDSF
jgi:hypothetical protein